MIFNYPEPKSGRRHGPANYTAVASYRPWLRDEFEFRCVYCLKRESWGQVRGEFDADHFLPQSLNPELALQYENLVYSCRGCNLVKLDQKVANPVEWLASQKIRVSASGSLSSDDLETQRLIRQLDLNSPQLIQWRLMWLRIVELAALHDSPLHHQLVGYPSDLPDLSRLRPPLNRRPEGVSESASARRQRGELPAAY